MKNTYNLLRYVIIAVIVLILGALGGWYYFLRAGENQTSATSTARGYGAPAPSFGTLVGSTYQNVLSALGISNGASSTPSNSQLWEVSQAPVAGFGWSASSSPAQLYFVERSTGYLLQTDTASRSLVRLTDTLRPKTYAAIVAEDGSVIERGLDDNGVPIAFAGAAASSSASSATSSSAALTGTLLPQGIEQIAANPVSKTIYYTIAGASGIALDSSTWSATGQKHLLSTPLSDWKIFALSDGSVYLAQSPLDGAEGYAYELQKGGSLAPIVQAPGLTILPRPSSGALLWGSSSNGTLELFAQSSAAAPAADLGIQTIADKCAWAPGSSLIAYCGVPQSIPSAQFLDDWYKGIVHTSDRIYEVDASAASTTLLYDPADANQTLDIEDPQVDPSGQYLAFINAADQSLWVLRIAPTQ